MDLDADHPNPLGWLKKVVSNLTYSYYRKQKVCDEKLLEIQDDCIVNTEEEVISKYEIARTRQTLDKMSPRERTCILLKHSGYKYSEIAEILGVQASTVGKMLLRAQNRFKEIYSDGGEK